MFKFLKDRLKKAVSVFSKKAEQEDKPAEDKKEEHPAEEEKAGQKEQLPEEMSESKIPSISSQSSDKPQEKKHIVAKLSDRIKKTTISKKKFDELFWDIELVLMENNVAVEVIEKIKAGLENDIVDAQIKRGELLSTIKASLKKSITGLFENTSFDLLDVIKKKKPFVICFVGINGSGKTTTIAKIVRLFKDKKLSCVVAAADTFRAAAIDQLQIHADKLDVKLIKHKYGSDAAAVAFDAIRHAESKNLDVVLIDTAGRMHSNINLMDEMKKIVKVAKPDLKLFIGEAITGNDCVEQAKRFNDAIGIDGIILSKADIDDKGGAAVSISYVTKKPILYMGTGQDYNNLEAFDSEVVLNSLGLD